MDIVKKEFTSVAIRFSVQKNEKEVGRASLFVIVNDLHREPYGLLEDVFVDEAERGKGIGSSLINQVIEEAKKRRCTKLIAQSRYGKTAVHALYEKLGFKDHGKNFRIDF